MAHGGRQAGDSVITQRKFWLFTKKRNACKSRKCAHDQIKKKKKNLPKGSMSQEVSWFAIFRGN